MRNTVVIVAPGNGKFVTRHHISTQVQRPWIFSGIEYFASNRKSGDWPIRAGIATAFLEKANALPKPSGPPNGKSVLLRPTASYWLPVLLGPTPVLDADGAILEDEDSGVASIDLRGHEITDDVVAVLAGKISYLWWSSIGDDFHVNPRECDTPRALALAAKGHGNWDKDVTEVLNAGRDVTFFVLNAGKEYVNVRWNNARSTTDFLDRAVVSSIGGTEEDWRAINTLYRQVMRSSGDGRGRYATAEEIHSQIGW